MPKGRPRNIGRRMLNYQIRRIMSRVPMAVKSGTKRTLLELAPEFLKSTINEQAAFNNYLGNLEEAYVAIVVTNGQRQKVFYHSVKKRGEVTERKSKIKGDDRMIKVIKLTRKRHEILVKRRNLEWGKGKDYKGEHKWERRPANLEDPNDPKSYYRYFNEKENERGYKKRAASLLRGNGYIGGQSVSKTGKVGVYRSFIQIRNVAPYAAYVQYAKDRKTYNVLRGAHIDMLRGRTTQLLKNAVIADLKKYGFRQEKYKHKSIES